MNKINKNIANKQTSKSLEFGGFLQDYWVDWDQKNPTKGRSGAVSMCSRIWGEGSKKWLFSFFREVELHFSFVSRNFTLTHISLKKISLEMVWLQCWKLFTDISRVLSLSQKNKTKQRACPLGPLLRSCILPWSLLSASSALIWTNQETSAAPHVSFPPDSSLSL